MFSVLFEVYPKTEQWDAYLGNAKMLKPELEQVEGFIDNIRYRSLKRDGWILSLSTWRDEKSVVRWRTKALHHQVQERGRNEVFNDYHLRVGEITADTRIPEGCRIVSQRLDETEVGEGPAATLIQAKMPADGDVGNPNDLAERVGFDPYSHGDCIDWDIYDAVLEPGNLVLMTSWRSLEAATAFGGYAQIPEDGRFRAVRVVRNYSMFDRREAPQFYPDAVGRASVHA